MCPYGIFMSQINKKIVYLRGDLQEEILIEAATCIKMKLLFQSSKATKTLVDLAKKAVETQKQ